MNKCQYKDCSQKLTDNRQKYCVIHRDKVIDERRKNRQDRQRKAVRQANLPEAAYPVNFSSLGYYATQAQKCEGQTANGRCNKQVTDAQRDYSLKNFGKILCYDCQRNGLNDYVPDADEDPKKPKRRGFAAMSAERQREIAAAGGAKAHRMGVAHRWTKEEAAKAGRIGGNTKKRLSGKSPEAIKQLIAELEARGKK